MIRRTKVLPPISAAGTGHHQGTAHTRLRSSVRIPGTRHHPGQGPNPPARLREWLFAEKHGEIFTCCPSSRRAADHRKVPGNSVWFLTGPRLIVRRYCSYVAFASPPRTKFFSAATCDCPGPPTGPAVQIQRSARTSRSNFRLPRPVPASEASFRIQPPKPASESSLRSQLPNPASEASLRSQPPALSDSDRTDYELEKIRNPVWTTLPQHWPYGKWFCVKNLFRLHPTRPRA